MQSYLRQSAAGVPVNGVVPEQPQYMHRPDGSRTTMWTERGPTMTSGGFFPTNPTKSQSVSMESLEESVVPAVGSPDRSGKFFGQQSLDGIDCTSVRNLSLVRLSCKLQP